MRILVSACLMGLQCRYDGGGKQVQGLEALMEKAQLVPFCAEIYGGLPIPRVPSERQGARVVSAEGADVTQAFERGAQEGLRLCRLYGCEAALLKERSPSCGHGQVYDGSFSGALTQGDGVLAALLLQNGIAVFGESQLEALIAKL